MIQMHPRIIANKSGRWEVPDNIDTSNFDFSWLPVDIYDPPFIHQFGTQWQKSGGPRYVVPGATQIKYVEFPRAIAVENKSNRCWRGAENIEFDWSWHPDDTEPPFIYQFGTQWQKTGGPRYVVPGATAIKYVEFPKAKKLADISRWKLLWNDLDIDSFDWSWHSDSSEDELNLKYVFGCDYYSAEEMPCIEYGNGSCSKYMNDLRIKFKPIDIVFMSNGEVGENDRYERLCKYANREVVWVKNVDGRENAIRRCIEVSNSEWVLVFPGKVNVDENFDFDWQPKRNGIKRHFIFYVRNLVNGLCYGHQAPVAYNRDIVMNTKDYGLDFTMSGAVDIVPICAGIAEYNLDPIMTWRTAFREAIKLKVGVDSGDSESLERLNIWTTVGDGLNGNWSISGACDGIDYYNSVGGEHSKLMLTFKWSWLQEYWNKLYCK